MESKRIFAILPSIELWLNLHHLKSCIEKNIFTYYITNNDTFWLINISDKPVNHK